MLMWGRSSNQKGDHEGKERDYMEKRIKEDNGIIMHMTILGN